jgi:hypothetical protein
LKQLLMTCAPRLTHLGLGNSLTYGGPHALLNLSQWVPHLQVLDVSGNMAWVTEPLLRTVYQSFLTLWNRGTSHFDNGKGNQHQDPLDEQEHDDDHHDAKLFGMDGAPTQILSSPSSSSSSSSLSSFKQSPCFQQQQQLNNRNLQQRQQPRLLIKATGCLSRSSQVLMGMEFGTLF